MGSTPMGLWATVDVFRSNGSYQTAPYMPPIDMSWSHSSSQTAPYLQECMPQ